METTEFKFIVIVPAPAGVSMAEVADHLADASRLAAAEYDAGDPMSRLGPLEVLGSVVRAKLAAGGFDLERELCAPERTVRQ